MLDDSLRLDEYELHVVRDYFVASLNFVAHNYENVAYFAALETKRDSELSDFIANQGYDPHEFSAYFRNKGNRGGTIRSMRGLMTHVEGTLQGSCYGVAYPEEVGWDLDTEATQVLNAIRKAEKSLPSDDLSMMLLNQRGVLGANAFQSEFSLSFQANVQKIVVDNVIPLYIESMELGKLHIPSEYIH